MKHSVVLLYHYFNPDDVVSARLFSDLAVDLEARGCDVTAMPAVRSCHDGNVGYSKRESWAGGKIHRVWRPAWSQKSNKGRVGNAIFVLAAWTWRAITTPRDKPQTVIIGTDPILGVMAAIPWRVFRPGIRIIHWCHDVYPQAAIADNLLKPESMTTRLLNWLLRRAYRRCDVIADLGPCMRRVLQHASGDEWRLPKSTMPELVATPSEVAQRQSLAKRLYITLPPWSLVEPSEVPPKIPKVRASLFGDASLGLLYSGNLGRAHLYKPFLQLARLMRDDSTAFCYGGRGPRFDELQREVSPEDQNVRFAGFAPESELEQRLAAADVHMVSLQASWTGTVVPSKFFGSIAAGRPVLFAGSDDSALAVWIRQFKLGWIINDSNTNQIAEALRLYGRDYKAQNELQQHCQVVYRQCFSRLVQAEAWHQLLTRGNP